MNSKNLIFIAGISGALCVILGAFGAHSLKEVIDPQHLQTFETGVRYQFYHTLVLFICALYADKTKYIRIAAGFFISGILFFSFSLYLLSMNTLLGIESWVWLGPVTPLGGLMFIIGWLVIAFSAGKIQNDAEKHKNSF